MDISQMKAEVLQMNPLECFLKKYYELGQQNLSRLQVHHQLFPMVEEVRLWICSQPQQMRSPGIKRLLTAFDAARPLRAEEEERFQESHVDDKDYELAGNRHLELSQHMRYTSSGRHDHEFIEIAYLMQGQCVHHFWIDGMECVSHMEAGDALIIPPGQEHSIGIFDDATVMFNFLVRADIFQNLFLSKLPEKTAVYDFFAQVLSMEHRSGYLRMETDETGDLDDCLLRILNEKRRDTSYSEEICDNLLANWFLYLLRHQKNLEDSGHVGDRGKSSTVLSMLLFVETNCETVSLEQMQERYHFSLSYLNRIFKKETGITIKQYILDRRMEKARKMLEQTDLTVTEVAERMGYESSAYFITSFRKYYGITPLQARKEGKLSQKVK